MKISSSILTVVVVLTIGSYAQQQAREAHVTPVEAVKFTPLDPSNPKGIQVSVVSGDLMAKAPVTFFMKLPKGPAPLHSHSAGYHGTVVAGQAKHWPEGGEKTAKVLRPGSHWYQPATQNHGDECLSAECVLLLQMEGGFDFTPAKK